jgi:hypothetical protein
VLSTKTLTITTRAQWIAQRFEHTIFSSYLEPYFSQNRVY